jgi:hypothetical protein
LLASLTLASASEVIGFPQIPQEKTLAAAPGSAAPRASWVVPRRHPNTAGFHHCGRFEESVESVFTDSTQPARFGRRCAAESGY